MTDKEKAEEWVKSNSDESVYSFQGEQLQNAFLAGLEAGSLQWHKVAEGDLPEKEDVCLIYTTKGFCLGHYEQGGADGKVDYCGEPYSDFTEYPSEEELVAKEVIAWCEIPTFGEGVNYVKV